MSEIIRMFVMSVFFVFIDYMFFNMYNRDKNISSIGSDNLHYVVKPPKELRYVYLLLTGIGIVMFITFFIFMLMGNPTVTIIHLVIALIVLIIGLLVTIYATKFIIVVNDEQFEVNQFFHDKEVILFSQVEKAIIKTKKTNNGVAEQIIVYKDGKDIFKVEYLFDNYDLFKGKLIQYGKLIDGNLQ